MDNYYIKSLETVFNITHIINISYYKFPKNFKFSGESHDFWEFVYVDHGELIITAGIKQYILKQGEMAFHRPNEFHNIEANGNQPSNVVVISFVCNSPAMEFFENKILFLEQYEKNCLKSIIRESKHSYEALEKSPPIINMRKREDAEFATDQIIKTNLEQILIYIHRRGTGIQIKNRTIRSNQEHNFDFLVLQAVDIMEKNLSQKITLDYIANQLFISSSYLKKVFKEQTGESIMSYLSKLRIDEAKRLIQESYLNFTQIAEIVGYGNIYYFSKVFKKETGMTLTNYSLSINISEERQQ